MRRRGWNPASPDDDYLCDASAYHDICNTGALRHDVCNAGALQHDHDNRSLGLLKRPQVAFGSLRIRRSGEGYPLNGYGSLEQGWIATE
jgi:hypothetical protein